MQKPQPQTTEQIRLLIEQSGIPRKTIAKLSGIPYNSLSAKLNELAPMTQKNIDAIKAAIRSGEIMEATGS